MFPIDGDGGECGEPGEDNTVTLGHRSDQILLSLPEIASPAVYKILQVLLIILTSYNYFFVLGCRLFFCVLFIIYNIIMITI